MPKYRPYFFPAYRDLIRTHGAAASQRVEAVLERDGYAELVYTPFETVNTDAKLVLVGITPGPNQITSAYERAAECLARGGRDNDALQYARTAAGFDGGRMRDALNRILNAYRIPAIFGLRDAAQFWDDAAHLLQATSLVPHAAYHRGRPFAGSFSKLRNTPLFDRSFQRDFLPSIAEIPEDAVFVGLGPTVDAALTWCIENGYLTSDRVLGAIPHPSPQSGSQMDVFLGVRDPSNLDQNDPVRKRLPWLMDASANLAKRVGALLESDPQPDPPVAASTVPAKPGSSSTKSAKPSQPTTSDPVSRRVAEQDMQDAGYTRAHVTAKLSRYSFDGSPPHDAYLVRSLSTIAVIFHPDTMDTVKSVSADLGIGRVTRTRHSNLTRFPADPESESGTRYGVRVQFDTRSDLRQFLTAFQRALDPTCTGTPTPGFGR